MLSVNGKCKGRVKVVKLMLYQRLIFRRSEASVSFASSVLGKGVKLNLAL